MCNTWFNNKLHKEPSNNITLCVRAWVRACVYARVRANLCCVFVYLCMCGSACYVYICTCERQWANSGETSRITTKKTQKYRSCWPRDTTVFHKLRLHELDFTQRPDWAVSPEDSDEDVVTASSGALAAEGAHRDVSCVLLRLRQFTPQEVAVEGAFVNRLLHRVHVNLQ